MVLGKQALLSSHTNPYKIPYFLLLVVFNTFAVNS